MLKNLANKYFIQCIVICWNKCDKLHFCKFIKTSFILVIHLREFCLFLTLILSKFYSDDSPYLVINPVFTLLTLPTCPFSLFPSSNFILNHTIILLHVLRLNYIGYKLFVCFPSFYPHNLILLWFICISENGWAKKIKGLAMKIGQFCITCQQVIENICQKR